MGSDLLLDIFNSLLSLSLLLALSIKYQFNGIPIGSLLDSASESDSKSNESKMSTTRAIGHDSLWDPDVLYGTITFKNIKERV